MKRKRRFAFFGGLLLSIMMGVSGCMSQNRQAMIDYMLEETEKKYGMQFDVEYFLPAKDRTYHNKLTLSKDGYIFNAYQCGESSVGDDYISVIISKRVMDYVMEGLGEIPTDMKTYSFFGYIGFDGFTYEDAVSFDVREFINTKELTKIVFIVRTTEPFEAHKETIFKIYEALISLNPKVLDLQLIQTQRNEDELEKMLNNLEGYYTNQWSKYQSVVDYVSVFNDMSITNPDDLIKR